MPLLALLTWFLLVGGAGAAGTPSETALSNWFAPCAITDDPNGEKLFIAGERSKEVIAVGTISGKEAWRVRVPDAPTGLAFIASPPTLLITCAGQQNLMLAVDPAGGLIVNRWNAGSGVCAPVVGPTGSCVYACNRYDHTVVKVDLASGQVTAVAQVLRELVSASLSADRQTLAVAHLLPAGAANLETVRAGVTLLEAVGLKELGVIWLPNGSSSVRSLACHPSKDVCAVVHTIGRFQIPTTQVEYGWMNINVVSFLSLSRKVLLGSVVLDEARRGAANPWAVCWAPDGHYLCITHAGTGELSIADFPTLEQKLEHGQVGSLVSDFSFLKGLRRRANVTVEGPRSVAIEGRLAYVAGFFSDSVSVLNLESGAEERVLRLNPGGHRTPEREGERLFNDAAICHQQWQSCSSCHPDGRADGLNWDLLNDGIGNAKNTKSLLLAHRTAPAMSLGERETAEQAVRAGLKHILFAHRPELEAQAIDAYLRSMTPVPSPFLVDGHLSKAAQRGKRLFDDRNVGCAVCHPAPLFTDCHRHVVAEGAKKGEEAGFDTPTLVECWRTAPYLHDGSATSIQGVLTTKNRAGKHGRTSHLSPREIADLAEYVLSL